jgi:hypothetical protein
MQESVSSRVKMRRKGMIHNRPMDFCTRNHRKERQNGERMPVLILVPGSHERLTSRKRIQCARNMEVHVRHGSQSTKGIKRDKKLESHATKKGAKKLVSSDFAKTLVKESSDKD